MPVDGPVGATGNAIVVPVRRVGEREDLPVGHRVEQPEPEDRRRAAPADRRGAREHRRLAETAHRQEGGGHAVRDDGTAARGEVVARAVGAERGRVGLHLVSHPTDDGLLVTLAARRRVEQRPQAGGRCERPQEDTAAARERRALRRGQERQGRADRCDLTDVGTERASGAWRTCECLLWFAGDNRDDQHDGKTVELRHGTLRVGDIGGPRTA